MDTLLLIASYLIFAIIVFQVIYVFIAHGKLSESKRLTGRTGSEEVLNEFVARLVDVMHIRKSRAKEKMRAEFRGKDGDFDHVAFSFYPGVDSAAYGLPKRDLAEELKRIPSAGWMQINSDIIKPLDNILPPRSFDQIRMRERGKLRTGMHAAIAEVEKKYRFFNFSPMSLPLVEKICEGEGINIVYDFELDGLYSALAVYRVNGITKGTIFVRPRLHRCQVMFLILYELGHWFLHAKVSADFETNDISELLAKGARDIEATHFALVALFPTPWIYYEQHYRRCGEPIKNLLMDYFDMNYGKITEIREHNQRLAEEVEKNIVLRTESYEYYMSQHLDMMLQFLPARDYLNPKMMELMKEAYSDHSVFACATTDLDAKVNWCSERFLALLMLKREDVIDKPLIDNILGESRKDFSEQMKMREEGKKGIYAAEFFSRNADGFEIVWIVGWPVVYDEEKHKQILPKDRTLTFGLIIPRSALGDLRVSQQHVQ